LPLEIGAHTYGSIVLVGGGNVKVGKFCSIANEVYAEFAPDHRTDWISTYPFMAPELLTYVGKQWNIDPPISGHPTYRLNIDIGNDVWIGQKVTLLGGTRVGDGAIIGMHSVVAGEVPPYTIVAGNSAEVKKLRFPQEAIDRVLVLRWWDWPDELIERIIPHLCNTDVWKFLEIAEEMAKELI